MVDVYQDETDVGVGIAGGSKDRARIVAWIVQGS